MTKQVYDLIVIGAGVAGPRVAQKAVEAGASVLLIEAGEHFQKHTYPRKEIDSNAKLYWGGGIELNHDASLGILRPKVVGGGSVVNQALLDRFDDDAFDSWRAVSKIDYLSTEGMRPWYEKAEEKLIFEKVPVEYKNGNAKVFEEGFKKNGYSCGVLTRAQSDCRFEKGNDCIECLSGCRIESKQSSNTAILPGLLEKGLELVSSFEVFEVKEEQDGIKVSGKNKLGEAVSYSARYLALAAGAIGNSKILLRSGFDKKLKTLGHEFYTHPQSMCLGIYQEKINAHKGPLQSFKSTDPNFRKNGFKLENVFAPPVAIGMLIPGLAAKHLKVMKNITHMACVEVAVRDTHPGQIKKISNDKFKIIKSLNGEDRERESKGLLAIDNIFKSTGAKEIIRGQFRIGLHLMGGLNLGVDPSKSVTGPDFRLHHSKRIFAVDSSLFPNAPGINPSLTIMALAFKAADELVKAMRSSV